MSKELILLGGGAFAVEVASYIQDVNSKLQNSDPICEVPELVVTDIVDPGGARLDDIESITRRKLTVHSDLQLVKDLARKVAVICLGDSFLREKVYKEIQESGVPLATIVHPTAIVASTATIGQGVLVCPQVFVAPYAQIDINAALGVGAVVGHDTSVGRSAVLSPRSCMGGHSRCGTAAFLGMGAILVPHVSLGNFSKLSAGSVLKVDTGEGFVMHGNPALGRQMFKVP